MTPRLARPAVSRALLIPLAVSTLLGAIAGSAFHWASPGQDWNIFTAAMLWTLLASAGTLIGRYAVERLRRGQWREGLRLAFVQSFPLTTAFLLAATLVAGQPALLPAVALVAYGSTLAVALAVALLGILTSPYRRRPS